MRFSRLAAAAPVLLAVACATSGPRRVPGTSPEGGPWTRLPPMRAARNGLSLSYIDGRLYAAGGNDARGCVPTAESYDPRRETWTPIAPPLTPTTFPASGVVDGKLILAGGGCAPFFIRPTTAVQEYDPKRDAWSPLTPLRVPRDGAGAVLDGKLYFIGGNRSGYCTSRVEAYDPSSRTWTPRAPLPVAACEPSAASFGGRIYVFGGADTSGRKYDSVWIYDPRADSWRRGAPMPTARYSFPSVPFGDRIYTFGGYGVRTFSDAVEVYDPARDAWSVETPLPAKMESLAAASDGRRIYLAGGDPDPGAPGDARRSVWAYDPARDASDGEVPARGRPWTRLAPMRSPRYMPVLQTVGGRLYVFGGRVSMSPSNARVAAVPEAYDVRRGVWSSLPAMEAPPFHAPSGVLDGRIVIAGGDDGAPVTSYRATARAYDPRSGSWSSLPPLPVARNGPGAVLDGRFYVLGGDADGRCTSRVDVLSPGARAWAQAAPLPMDLCSAAATAFRGRIYVFGGTTTNSSVTFNSVWIYDPAANSWSAGAPMPTGRLLASAVALGGRIYVLGGWSSAVGIRGELEAYDPAENAWYLKTSMPVLNEEQAVAAYGGRLYAAGGWLAPGGRGPGPVTNGLWSYDPSRDPRDERVVSPPAPRPAVFARSQPMPPPAPAPADPDLALLPPGRVQPRPDDFALVVGIDHYRGVPEARYGARDADDFARYAEDVLGVPKDNVILLTGDKAARTDLVKYVEEWLPKNVEKDSRVYFYYSGHGAPDPLDGTAYLVPWDGDPSFLRSTAFPLARLYRDLGALPAESVVVFLDSCFSGEGDRSLLAANVRPLVTVRDEPFAARDVSVLSAASGEETAGSSDAFEHGLFTDALLRGLSGAADADRDGHVSLDELYRFVKDRVVREAHRQNREQHPRLRTFTPDLRLD
ncbi:MAG: caspase family protein [Elusimicrobia bacterium]|nr:caspase family protein [Elusimicrobiota bacterium]